MLGKNYSGSTTYWVWDLMQAYQAEEARPCCCNNSQKISMASLAAEKKCLLTHTAIVDSLKLGFSTLLFGPRQLPPGKLPVCVADGKEKWQTRSWKTCITSVCFSLVSTNHTATPEFNSAAVENLATQRAK